MGFEKQMNDGSAVPSEENKENRLSYEEAEEMANLLKGVLAKSGHSMEDVTSEQYDWALEELERVKRLASEESDIDYVMKSIINTAGMTVFVYEFLLVAVADVIIDYLDSGKFLKQRINQSGHDLKESASLDYELFKKKYLSSRSELVVIEKYGKKMEKADKKWMENTRI
jgi:hypothetical protein